MNEIESEGAVAITEMETGQHRQITVEDGVSDCGAVLLGRGFVVAVGFARVGRLFVFHVLTHFVRFPLVGERRHGRLHVALRRREIVALVLVERPAQALKIGNNPPFNFIITTSTVTLTSFNIISELNAISKTKTITISSSAGQFHPLGFKMFWFYLKH